MRIGSVFHSSVKPYLARQSYPTIRKRGYLLNRDPFFEILPKSLHQIAQIKFENCKVFIASEGTPPSDTLFPNKEDLHTVTDYDNIFMFQSITHGTMDLLKF